MPGQIAAGVGKIIREIGIPPRPAVLVEIDKEMERDTPDFSHLSKIISSDVALAAGLVMTANSPYFGADRKVRSVHEAILVLGLNLVTRTIAMLSLQRAFGHIAGMDRFWDASATTARLSGWLARQLRKRCGLRPEDAYTFGLFHDCGIPVLMSPFPAYRELLERANGDQSVSIVELENKEFSINHAEVGADLAGSWLLPEEIVEAIRYHHDICRLAKDKDSQSPKVTLPLIAIVQLAEHLLHERTGMSHSCEWDKVGEVVMEVLGLDQEQVDELFSQCHEAIAGEAE